MTSNSKRFEIIFVKICLTRSTLCPLRLLFALTGLILNHDINMVFLIVVGIDTKNCILPITCALGPIRTRLGRAGSVRT
jgi:hypothetical protein